MKIELNDETLTAYALGELASDETKVVEKLLADAAKAGNEAPRKTLDEIRAAIATTEAAFAETAEDSALTGEQRRGVFLQAARKKSTRASRSAYAWGSLAAMLLFIAGAAVVLPMLEPAREAARTPEGQRLADLRLAKRQAEDAAPRPTPALPSDAPTQDDLRYQAGVKIDQAGANEPSPITEISLFPRKEPEKKREPEFGMPQEIDEVGKAGAEGLGASEAAATSPAASAVTLGASVTLNDTASSRAGELQEQVTNLLRGQDAEQLTARGYVNEDEQAKRERLEAVGYSDGSVDFGAKARTQLASVELRRVNADPRRISVESVSSESYQRIIDNGFVRVTDQPLSTFSIDVDTASYSNLRRFLDSGQLPPADAVRVEELINYFDYAYPAPTDGAPFAAHFEAAACPWTPAHTLVRIGLKGREVPRAQRPATNLVFLIDVSGSMQPENKLPLVKRAMAMLTRQLDERDRVSIVTYASGVNLALPVTNASQQERILGAIENLGAGGSTNGAGGIQLAYQSARENFLPGGVNRVILATDGDFNVGLSDNDSLLGLIQQEAKSGVFLSVFGFGMGNLKDDKLELLADKGNGVYGYIDTESEARKVFVEKLSGTLVTIAKDVKIQVEFNPARVAAYRLIGYENRALAAQDFNDDRKDAGEIGAGHTVTALYEVVPAGEVIPAAGVDSLRYQSPEAAVQNEAARAIAPAGKPAHADEFLLVKLRYKDPAGAESKLLQFPLTGDAAPVPSDDLKFAGAVAAFGKLLRGSPLGDGLGYDAMMQLAQAGLAASDDPRRAEMIHLMLQARPLIEGSNPATADPSRYQRLQ